MIWTILGVVFAAISAFAAILALPLKRKKTINEMLFGKQVKSHHGGVEVRGEFELGLSNKYWIHISNQEEQEKIIKSVLYYKGNPKHDGYMFYAYPLSEMGHYIKIGSHQSKDVYIDASSVVKYYYENNGEHFGKASDPIYIVVKDYKEYRYILNTYTDIKGFTLQAQYEETNKQEKTKTKRKRA